MPFARFALNGLLIALAASPASAAAPAAPVSPELERVLLRFDKAQEAIRSLSTEFTETVETPLLKEPSVLTTGFFVVGTVLLGGLAIAFNAFATFVIMAVVSRDERLGEAARSAAVALQGRWVLAVEASILTFIFTLGIGVLGMAFAVAILMPIVVLYLLAASVGLVGALTLLTVVSAVAIVGAIVFTGSLIATFQAVAWTLLWNRMAEGRAVAKVHRVWDQLKERYM
jgi:hypothetical protein